MPFVHVRIAGPAPAPEQGRRLQAGVTDLMADVLGKDRALTAILVEPAPIQGWSVGGEPVTVAAHVEATVTAGTSTAAEIAAFNARATALLKTVLGSDLPVATYVVVRQVPADAWGYDGLTQAARRIAARAA